MRIFLTGAKGQLGTDLVAQLSASGHELIAVDIDGVDLTNRDDVIAAIGGARPDVVVHPAAFTAVDRCETEVHVAYSVNVIGTRNVVEAARRVGAPVTYVSTDYVFDGSGQRPWSEADTPAPLSVYGADGRSLRAVRGGRAAGQNQGGSQGGSLSAEASNAGPAGLAGHSDQHLADHHLATVASQPWRTADLRAGRSGQPLCRGCGIDYDRM